MLERTSDEGRVGEIVIDELSPLHQEKRPLFTLTGPVTHFGQRLRHQSSAGQRRVGFRQPRAVDTYQLIQISNNNHDDGP